MATFRFTTGTDQFAGTAGVADEYIISGAGNLTATDSITDTVGENNIVRYTSTEQAYFSNPNFTGIGTLITDIPVQNWYFNTEFMSRNYRSVALEVYDENILVVPRNVNGLVMEVAGDRNVIDLSTSTSSIGLLVRETGASGQATRALFGAADDVFFSNDGAGADVVTAAAGNDLVVFGAGADFAFGNEGNDTLMGNAGNDTLNAHEGNDMLFGGAGVDVLVGGAGADYFVFEYADAGALDRVLDFNTGNDSIVIAYGKAQEVTALNYNALTGYLEVTMTEGAAKQTIQINIGTGFAANRFSYEVRETADGEDGRVFIGYGSGSGFGGFSGTGGNTGGGGSGTPGNDTISLGAADDAISLGLGNDTADGGDGDDAIYGNEGNDQLTGGFGNDTIFGNQDNDLIFGNDGLDQLYGSLGNDTIYGGKQADTIFGGQGNDLLFGGNGHDTIRAGLGNDTIQDGVGNDTIFSGQGADFMVFSAEAGNNVVEDFNPLAGDRIFVGGGVFETARALVSIASSDAAGNAVLSFGSAGGSITLKGWSRTQLSADWFSVG